MQFLSTDVNDVFVLVPEIHEDQRGHFFRTFCEDEFKQAGIPFRIVQSNLSHNKSASTLRGMHFQVAPHGEPKIVQCVAGRIWDVALDLRPTSSTYLRWAAIELLATRPQFFYIPEGCAHGFITLEDNSDVLYLMGAPYVAEAARGVRWNDPAFAIEWPENPKVISDRDANYPNFLNSE